MINNIDNNVKDVKFFLEKTEAIYIGVMYIKLYIYFNVYYNIYIYILFLKV